MQHDATLHPLIEAGGGRNYLLGRLGHKHSHTSSISQAWAAFKLALKFHPTADDGFHAFVSTSTQSFPTSLYIN